MLSLHKPSGVWKKRWFSVTWAVPSRGQAYSVPFSDPKDLSKYVDAAKVTVRKLLGKSDVVFEIIRHKEEPSLTWFDAEEGTTDWKNLFRITEGQA